MATCAHGGLRLVGDWASHTKLFCHGPKRDYLSRVSQRARGATNKKRHMKGRFSVVAICMSKLTRVV